MEALKKAQEAAYELALEGMGEAHGMTLTGYGWTITMDGYAKGATAVYDMGNAGMHFRVDLVRIWDDNRTVTRLLRDALYDLGTGDMEDWTLTYVA